MFKTLEEEWDNVLAYIKERHKISDVSFNTWLLPLTLYSVNEFLVVKVMVPDVNYIGYIKKRYGPMFKTSIEAVVHKACEIEFITKEQAVDECTEASQMIERTQANYGKEDEPKEPQRFFDQIYKASLRLLIGALVESKALTTQDILEIYEVLRMTGEYE